jgi:probable rRNA maturation factor
MPIALLSRAAIVTPGLARRLSKATRHIVRSTLWLERRGTGEIAILLADDAFLRALNRAWRGIDRATDVLSFPYADPAEARVEGDLAISMERVFAQAVRYRVTPGRELARLLVHGTLHLAGHDHHAPAERRRMRACEQSALGSSRVAIAALDAVLGSLPRS